MRLSNCCELCQLVRERAGRELALQDESRFSFLGAREGFGSRIEN